MDDSAHPARTAIKGSIVRINHHRSFITVSRKLVLKRVVPQLVLQGLLYGFRGHDSTHAPPVAGANVLGRGPHRLSRIYVGDHDQAGGGQASCVG